MARLSDEKYASLNSWHADWSGLQVAVLGLGVTGFSVADTLAELGAEVLVISDNRELDRERLLQVIGAQFFTGTAEEQLAKLTQFDPQLVVVSPGYPASHPLTAWAESAQIPVWGDIDLAWRVRDKVGEPADWICITGTNGKTTTTQLTAHMLLAGGFRTAPVGNIGVPVLDAIRDPAGFDVLVVELSSHQLHRIKDVEPYASVVLNIAEDHLEWHGGFTEYVAAKANIYERTRVACVYNRHDSVTMQMVENADVKEGARAVSFGLDTPPLAGLGLVEDVLADRGFHAERKTSALELMTLAELQAKNMAQPHMVANILAAAALARAYGVAPAQIAAAVLEFTPDRHRIELVAEHNGIRWIDDSKATNAHAAAASLRACDSVVWVLGGLLKGVDLAPLIAAQKERIKAAVVIGAEQQEILAAFNELLPELPVTAVTVSDMTDGEQVMSKAVAAAAHYAESGDTVLLAPAAASMDQFESYSDRGEKFGAAVHTLLGQV